MNSLEAFLSDTRKAKSLMEPDLANKENEAFDAGNCDPKTQEMSWRNEVWDCQREL
jgi:hypothetical protein